MRKLCVAGLTLTLTVGCGSSSSDRSNAAVDPGGNPSGTGGMSAGGTSAGGMSAGGTSAGGTSAGGTSAGGTSAGGTSAGGTSAGGMSVGDMSAGLSAIKEFCIAQTSARCDRVFDCRPVQAAQQGTLAECKTSTAEACAAINFCPFGYDPAAGARCITALETYTCVQLTTDPVDCAAACP